jgi:predicted nuclease of restriction endonuclease-like (RecB) superfamily
MVLFQVDYAAYRQKRRKILPYRDFRKQLVCPNPGQEHFHPLLLAPAVLSEQRHRNSRNEEKTADFQDRLEFIKNPAVLEFLGLPDNYGYIEAELEKTIIDHIQQFLLELGKGFAFVSRQQHIQTETVEFYIDSVFYNFILKCFVLIELKTNKITHQDIGQLDMYVRMFDDIRKRDGDNPTIGILLCTETDKTIARYSVLNENQQLFAAKYMPYLPTEEELIAEIERQKEILKIQFSSDKNTSDVL